MAARIGAESSTIKSLPIRLGLDPEFMPTTLRRRQIPGIVTATAFRVRKPTYFLVRNSTYLQLGLVGDGELEKFVAAMQIELGADVRAMRLDGARADEQFLSDFAARFALSDELQNAPFHR